MDDASTGLTAQSGRIIELSNSAVPMFYDAKVGRDYGSPAGGWSAEREKATVMSEESAQQLLEGALAQVAPFCRVVSP